MRIDAAVLTGAWPVEPVWFHGDLDLGNLLVHDGRLCAVIDVGCCGVGDPACDLALAWTFFSGPARRTFRESVDLDDDTWRRARGWVLWKALVTMAGMSSPIPTAPSNATSQKRSTTPCSNRAPEPEGTPGGQAPASRRHEAREV